MGGTGGATAQVEQLAAVEAVREVVADSEAEAEREETLAAREAAAREEAIATPDGRAVDGQFKIFDPGGCVCKLSDGGSVRRHHGPTPYRGNCQTLVLR